MNTPIGNKPSLGKVVHTLAQNRTTNLTKTATKPVIVVNGIGADVSNNDTNFARYKRKIISQRIILSLIDVAKQDRNTECLKSYWNTYHCLNNIISDGNRIYGKYCKNRICTICSGNRKAELINKYLPVINKWSEPYFVTLTIKSVTAKRLYAMMRAVKRGFDLIIQKYNKRHQRNKGIKLVGIKSLECNFNPIKKTYNPHFHIIVPNKDIATILMNEWLYYCNRKGSFWASKKAQDMRLVTNNETVLVEVIKYGSKIFTSIENKTDAKIEIPPKIYVKALHNILKAMNGLRLFDRFGFNLPKQQKTSTTKILSDYDTLNYDVKNMDWIDTESELKLSNYNLPAELQNILNKNLDTVLE